MSTIHHDVEMYIYTLIALIYIIMLSVVMYRRHDLFDKFSKFFLVSLAVTYIIKAVTMEFQSVDGPVDVIH